jgi:hypothetical protein
MARDAPASPQGRIAPAKPALDVVNQLGTGESIEVFSALEPGVIARRRVGIRRGSDTVLTDSDVNVL